MFVYKNLHYRVTYGGHVYFEVWKAIFGKVGNISITGSVSERPEIEVARMNVVGV